MANRTRLALRRVASGDDVLVPSPPDTRMGLIGVLESTTLACPGITSDGTWANSVESGASPEEVCERNKPVVSILVLDGVAS